MQFGVIDLGIALILVAALLATLSLVLDIADYWSR